MSVSSWHSSKDHAADVSDSVVNQYCISVQYIVHKLPTWQEQMRDHVMAAAAAAEAAAAAASALHAAISDDDLN